MVGPVLFSPESHDSGFSYVKKKSKKRKPGKKTKSNPLQPEKREPDDIYLSNRLLDFTGELQQRIALLNGSMRSNDLTVEEYKSRMQCLYDNFMDEVKCLESSTVVKKTARNRSKKFR